MIGLVLLRRYWLHLLTAAAVIWVGLALYGHGRAAADAEWSARWAQRDAADAIAARAEEQRLQQQSEKVQRDATQALEQARTDAASATAAADRLRGQLAKLQGRFTTGAAVGASSASTTRAAMVLSELLDSCVSQRQELAGAFDRSRIAGLACEASYDGLRP